MKTKTKETKWICPGCGECTRVFKSSEECLANSKCECHYQVGQPTPPTKEERWDCTGGLSCKGECQQTKEEEWESKLRENINKKTKYSHEFWMGRSKALDDVIELLKK